MDSDCPRKIREVAKEGLTSIIDSTSIKKGRSYTFKRDIVVQKLSNLIDIGLNDSYETRENFTYLYDAFVKVISALDDDANIKTSNPQWSTDNFVME